MNFLNINNFWNILKLEKYDLLLLEIIGTVSGIVSTWLASKEKITNYLFGLISVISFAIVFFQIHLYASLLLQFFFIIANFYGWYTWSDINKKKLKIRWLSFKQIIFYFFLIIVSVFLFFLYINFIFSFFTKYFLTLMKNLKFKVVFLTFQPDIFPFFDSCILILSVVAMILLIKKYIENWILWIIVNIINISIFTYQKIYIMALEYLFLSILSLYGLYSWLSIKKHQLH